MKSIFLLSALCAALNTQSQIETIINGTIEGLADGTKIFLVPYSLNTTDDKEYDWRDSATVKNSSFNFKVNKPYECVYELRITREEGSNHGKYLALYFGGGTINIKSTAGRFNGAQITGSAYAKDFGRFLSSLDKQPFAIRLAKFAQEDNALEKKIMSKLGNKQDSLRRGEINKIISGLDSMRRGFSKQWVESNLSSPASPPVILVYVKRNMPLKELEDLLDKLPEKSRDNFLVTAWLKKIEGTKITAIGKTAPEFSQKDTSDRNISLSSFRGKYVLIDFWASWCVPCRAENPNLVTAYKKFKEKNFEIISISLDKDRKEWIEAIRHDNLNWTHLSDLKFWDNAVSRLYAVDGVPSNLLIGPDGKILAKNIRGEQLDAELRNRIQ